MAKSNFIAAVCPSCGANIDLDKSLEQAFCSYCGTKIIIKDIVQKIKIVNHPTAENYLILANREFDNDNYENALKIYDEVLLLDANCYEAIIKKEYVKFILNRLIMLI